MKSCLKIAVLLLALSMRLVSKVSLNQLDLKEVKNQKIPERQLAGNSQAMLDAQDTRNSRIFPLNKHL